MVFIGFLGFLIQLGHRFTAKNCESGVHFKTKTNVKEITANMIKTIRKLQTKFLWLLYGE